MDHRADAAKLSVLLVAPADQSTTTTWLASHLEDHYQVMLAKSAQEALFLLSQRHVDLFLADEDIPDMTPSQFCQELIRHKDYDHAPIIVLTNHNEPELIEATLDAGATILLHKPLNEFELYNAIQVATRFKESQHETISLISKLKKMSQKDPLTDLYNRQVLIEQGSKEISKARRTQTPLSILMVDLDHFKTINDTYGHVAGDQVLMLFAGLLAENLRAYDLVVRYGGEEFVVILPHTTVDQAYAVAEKLRLCVEEYPFQTAKGRLSITVSVGVALYEQGLDNIEDLVQVADLALYKAKNSGRNRVAIFNKDLA